MPELQLYPYQVEAIKFGYNNKRVIIADEMGLGKTIEALGIAQVAKNQKDLLEGKDTKQKCLIVCPKIMTSIWRKEIKIWMPENTTAIILGATRKEGYDLMRWSPNRFTIVSYEMMRLIPDEVLEQYDLIIFDEAHRLKNRKALQSKGAIKLARNSDRVIMLTGTPIRNRVQDLWPLLHIARPKEYSSFWNFAKKYANARQGRYGWEMDDAVRHPEELKREIEPFFLRRTKQEVGLQLPPKRIIQLKVDLDDLQREWYTQMETEMVAKFKEADEITVATVVIAQIIRLRQVCISPTLITHLPSYLSPKYQMIQELVEETDEKIVIYSQFAEALKQLQGYLPSAALLIGSCSPAQREAALKAFRFGGTQVLLATVQLAGEGLTLTESNTAIFLDKFWTPAVNEQAQDRIHRISQENPVTIYELLATDTIEDWIEDMLATKSSIVDSVLKKYHVELPHNKKETINDYGAGTPVYA